MKKHWLATGISTLLIAATPFLVITALFRTSQPLTAMLIAIPYLLIGLSLFRTIRTTAALWLENYRGPALAAWTLIIAAFIAHIWLLSGLYNHG